MALSKDDIANMVNRYAGGDGETVAALAAAFNVSDQTVRTRLKAEGVYKVDAARSQTDAELGIGEEDDAPLDSGVALAALMNDPKFSKLIDAAVAARMANLAVPTPTSQSEDFKAFTASLAHLIEVNAMQQAGYIKPLPAEEIDRRADGLVQMRALLANYERAGTPPEYVVGEAGFFECTNAIQFQPGSRIRTYLPPPESFRPQNAEARAVMDAMFTWIGGPTPGIGELVEQAHKDAKQAPLVTSTMAPVQKPSRVELVQGPLEDVSRKRVAGSIVPERRGVTPGEPTGPIFVGADAA